MPALMTTLPVSLILIAQAGLLQSSAEARLEVCMDIARTDPATAISQASQWLGEETAPYTSEPQQCLGTAYMSLLRWDAARRAFTAARDDRPSSDHSKRAKLGAMAGNAALAADQYEDALNALEIAQGDAAAALLREIAGEISADRARALVALGRNQEARSALSHAREMAPQSVLSWLLSATLERRLEEFGEAQSYIETAGALASSAEEAEANLTAEIALEAGLIAALDGRYDTARKSWMSLLETQEDSAFSDQARSYLAQLDEPEPELPAQAENPSQP